MLIQITIIGLRRKASGMAAPAHTRDTHHPPVSTPHTHTYTYASILMDILCLIIVCVFILYVHIVLLGTNCTCVLCVCCVLSVRFNVYMLSLCVQCNAGSHRCSCAHLTEFAVIAVEAGQGGNKLHMYTNNTHKPTRKPTHEPNSRARARVCC